MIIRKLLVHQSVFLNDLITLKETAKELACEEVTSGHDISFATPINMATDTNMYDLHQALKS